MKFQCCVKWYAKTPARVSIAIMAFVASFLSYAVRLAFNLAIIAMVYPSSATKDGPECDPHRNVTSIHLPDNGERYHWDFQVQGQLKAAFGYAYFIVHIPAGIIADKFGARFLVFAAIFSQGVFTILVPACAPVHWGLVFALRFLAGIGGGVVFPALHSLVAKWAPPQEKGKFIFALMGGTFSTVVTWPAVGAIIEAWGWPASLYIVGVVCMLGSVLWVLLVYNAPHEHPCISEKELDYIRGAQEGAVKEEAGALPVLPVLKLLRCVPFWALMILHYGSLWGLFLLTTDTPVYLNDVLGFNIRDSGVIGSLPALGRIVISLASGFIVDWITAKQLWKNKTAMRKTFVVFSHMLAGIFMMSISFVECDITGAITLLILSLSMNGAATVTNLVNHHDLAPNYAGSLYGIMNGVGTTTLFIVPSVTSAVIAKHNGVNEWKIIFWIGAAFYLVCGTVFMIFGSAETQSWNAPTDEDSAAREARRSSAVEDAPRIPEAEETPNASQSESQAPQT